MDRKTRGRLRFNEGGENIHDGFKWKCTGGSPWPPLLRYRELQSEMRKSRRSSQQARTNFAVTGRGAAKEAARTLLLNLAGRFSHRRLGKTLSDSFDDIASRGPIDVGQ